MLWRDVSRKTAVSRAQVFRSFGGLGTVLEQLEQHRSSEGFSETSDSADQFALLVWHMFSAPLSVDIPHIATLVVFV